METVFPDMAYLYSNGDECTEITGGWAGRTTQSGSYSKSADSLNLKATDGSSSAIVNTVKRINTNGYSKLTVVHSNANGNASNNYLSILLEDECIHSGHMTTGFAKRKDTYDISDYNGMYQISIKMLTGGIGTDGSMFNYNLYELYLTK